MLEWILIISITMVSVTMLMFLSAFISIPNEASLYYDADRSVILYFYNSFNVFYLVISLLLFPFLEKHYIKLVYVSTIMTSIGCVGRYFVGNDVTLALAMTSLVAIAHVPIITAPYGLLKLFKPHVQGYAAAIPLFVPTLGVNFTILYGMNYINAGD